MKIAYVGTKGLPAKYGGFETCVEYVSNYTSKKNHKVIVYSVKSTTPYKGLNQNLTIKIVPQIGFPTLDRILREFYPIFCHLLDRDVIFHIYGPYIFMPILRMLGIKSILSTDGFEWNRESYSHLTKKIVYLGYKIGVKYANVVTVDSVFVRRWIYEHWKRKTIYIPYGPKKLRNHHDDNPLILQQLGLEKNGYYLFVGRLVPEKGIHLLVIAFNKLNTLKKLLILGKDPMNGDPFKNYLKYLANSKVIMIDPIFDDSFEDICVNSYVHVRPSINDSEGSNPVAIESLNYGNCLLVSDVPQNVEVMGDSAIFFPKNDIKALYRGLVYLEQHPDIVEEYKSKSKARAEKFSWEKITKLIGVVYEQLQNHD